MGSDGLGQEFLGAVNGDGGEAGTGGFKERLNLGGADQGVAVEHDQI